MTTESLNFIEHIHVDNDVYASPWTLGLVMNGVFLVTLIGLADTAPHIAFVGSVPIIHRVATETILSAIRNYRPIHKSMNASLIKAFIDLGLCHISSVAFLALAGIAINPLNVGIAASVFFLTSSIDHLRAAYLFKRGSDQPSWVGYLQETTSLFLGKNKFVNLRSLNREMHHVRYTQNIMYNLWVHCGIGCAFLGFIGSHSLLTMLLLTTPAIQAIAVNALTAVAIETHLVESNLGHITFTILSSVSLASIAYVALPAIGITLGSFDLIFLTTVPLISLTAETIYST